VNDVSSLYFFVRNEKSELFGSKEKCTSRESLETDVSLCTKRPYDCTESEITREATLERARLGVNQNA
jgi:hypothetical protein